MAGNDIIQQVRYEPDADLHFEGDGELAYGTNASRSKRSSMPSRKHRSSQEFCLAGHERTGAHAPVLPTHHSSDRSTHIAAINCGGSVLVL
jgi:hypothetical protein